MLKLQEQALGVGGTQRSPAAPRPPGGGGALAKVVQSARSPPSPRARSLLYNESLKVKTAGGKLNVPR